MTFCLLDWTNWYQYSYHLYHHHFYRQSHNMSQVHFEIIVIHSALNLANNQIHISMASFAIISWYSFTKLMATMVY